MLYVIFSLRSVHQYPYIMNNLSLIEILEHLKKVSAFVPKKYINYSI